MNFGLSVEAYLGLCQKSTINFFAEKVQSFKQLTIFAKRYIIVAWQVSKYALDRVSVNTC